MTTMMTLVKTPQEIENMRKSGQILAMVFAHLRKKLKIGISAKELSDIANQEIRALGGEASFLGYQGFPGALCVSLNDEVVHGIPSSQKFIKEGDIVSLDLGVTYQGMITDSAFSMIAGKSSNPRLEQLLLFTEQSLSAGIDTIKDGVAVGDISAAIEGVLSKNKYGIVRDLVGHGVGHQVHEEPNIPNYGHKGGGLHLRAGMTIAIEPMATLGGDDVYVSNDGWTVLTSDQSLSAHFEHTILITPDGAEILTII